MKTLTGYLLAGVAAAALLAPAAADAAVVRFDSIVGTWQNATPSGIASYNQNGTASPEVRWGTPSGQPNKSGYDFDAVTTPLSVTLPPNPTGAFDLGTFTHLNYPIASGTSITGIQLKLTAGISISNDGITYVPQGLFDFTYDFEHWETPNGADPCANGGAQGSGVNANGCADRVTFKTNLASTQFFTVGSEEYAVRILGFQEAGGNPMSAFWTMENKSNVATLKADIASRSIIEQGVPEPMTLALFGTGLAALGLALRRREDA